MKKLYISDPTPIQYQVYRIIFRGNMDVPIVSCDLLTFL